MSSQRKNLMIGTAGHVDHGKTALVKLLTGCETDTLTEEKQRGLTIDLGFAPCRLAGDRVVGIVDVPGHVDFIRNMVAGAHGIDVVMLVVAADDGIMPQTREHLHILTLMGLRHGLIALTKVDLADAARRAAVMDDLRRLLVGTFLAAAPICPVSNATGEGFDDFFEALNQVVNQCGERSSAGIFRVWVEDVFTIRGSGTVLTGIPSSGVVKVGDRLALLPTGAVGRMRRLQVYGEDATAGRAGECVAINIPELDHLSVRRGMVLAEPGTLDPVTMAEGEFQVLSAVKGGIEDYTEVQLHVGTAAVSARLAMLETNRMTAGQKQMVQLRFSEPLPLAPGERFVIRANLPASGQSGLATIGGGRILGVSNVRLRRKKQWTIDLLRARRDAIDDPVRWCELLLRETGRPVALSALPRQALRRPEEIGDILEKLRAANRVLETPTGALVHRSLVENAAEKTLAALKAFHAANPHRAGLEKAELLPLTGVNPELLDLALRHLVDTKHIEAQGTVYAQAGWATRLPDAEQRICDQITAAFEKAGCASPTVFELAAALQQPPAQIQKLVRLLTERGVLVRLEDELCVHRQAVQSAKELVLRLFARAPSFSTMEFRDALGVSRKYAVPLLDYLDKLRFTVRTGHNRTPGAEARKRLPAPG